MWTAGKILTRGFLVSLVGSLFVVGTLTSVQALSHARIACQEPGVELDSVLVRETVGTVASVVKREYFDPDVASRVDDALRRGLRENRYAHIDSGEALAETITKVLYEVTEDKHLAVTYIRPGEELERISPEARARAREARGRRSNFGVERVQILSGNVGYLDITSFYRPDEAREVIAAAMQTLRYADALILDMRANVGGSPGTVALLASYLIDTPGTLLFEIVPRPDDGEVDSYYTELPSVSHRDASRPVFVLTSGRTFSAGEGLAFILQERGRAEVVSELTAGAANPGRSYPVNDQFEFVVPNGRVRMAGSGRNWEGVGVTPDVRASASEALGTAHRRALLALARATSDERWAETLRETLERLDVPKSAAGKQVAVTFDDLPGDENLDRRSIQVMTDGILAALSSHNVPTIGFVTGKRVLVQDQVDVRIELLELWTQAGATLGNHTFSHLPLSTISLEEYTRDVVKGEVFPAHPMAGLKYFRAPNNDLGSSSEVHGSLREFLKTSEYVLTPFTIEHADYVFNRAFVHAESKGDLETAERIKAA